MKYVLYSYCTDRKHLFVEQVRAKWFGFSKFFVKGNVKRINNKVCLYELLVK